MERKTSVLEAVSILSSGRSFATSRLRSVIAFDRPSLTVFGQVTQASTPRMAIQVSRDEERRLRLDGAIARGQATLVGLPVLHLTPV